MSYQKDRDEFVAQIVSEVQSQWRAPMARDGSPTQQALDLARLILRNAATIQHCEELVCSSEAANRDRVPCPAAKSGKDEDCACDYDHQADKHRDTPRVQVQILRARQRIEAACKPWGIVPNCSGDPRGCVVKLLLPSGRWNSWGGKEDGFCVPVR